MMASELSVQRQLTPQLMDRVMEVASRGVDAETANRKAEWFYAYLETGDATGSVRKCHFDVSQPSWKGNQLVKQFYPLIVEAVTIRRAAMEPLALKVLEDVLRQDHMVPARDKDGVPTGGVVPDAKIMAVKVKAADSVLDRGLMPKGLALHGSVSVGGEGERASDWQAHLDSLVPHLGVEMVKTLPLVQQRPDMRAYLEEKYTIKVVSGSESVPQVGESVTVEIAPE